MKREALFEAVLDKYQVEPDYPWQKLSDYAVLRHRFKKKWFALVYRIEPEKLGLPGEGSLEAMNVKVQPELLGSLRMQPGILPAYHMNKEHWVTVLLETVPAEDILSLIDESYRLTR
ncbi:MmcQ/YjbR family DNA-binding protein [Dryocola sp. BD626]|uniref:MmcQ/YjbR family DNA-binding protein n=1 Tax=Dryocola sp. BD626 TaxID=3133273 RepID=UPI003F4FE019